MSRIDRGSAPYYDDYDSSKRYTQLMARPGRVAQAREFTQVQSLLKDLLKSVGDSIHKDGDIIEGCQISINQNKTVAQLSEGRVYIDGVVLPVGAQQIEITGEGIEVLGLRLDEVIVTETEDSTLRDPAVNFDNYNKAGCDRIKSTVTLTLNDTSAATIATLIDGDQQLVNYSPEYDVLTQTLARRTFDESGSYIVDGLKVRTENAESDGNYVAVIEAGKAYVLGYELGIPNARRLTIPRSTEYSLVTISNPVYISGTVDYKLDDDLYVKDIYQVTGTVKFTQPNNSITTGTDRTLLSQLNVVSILRVYVGDTVYVSGTDYELERDGTRYYVRWLNHNFPSSGTEYTVEYTYIKIFPSTAYSLVAVSSSHYLRWTAPGVEASHPINGTNFTVSYNQYLARKDVIYLDQYGNIGVKQGIPAEYGFEVAPDEPINTLALAVIMSPPNGSVASTSSSQRMTVSNVGLTRFTMSDIKDILDRVRVLEYDNAVVSLENDARSSYTENEKKGIITDPFVDFSRSDLTYNLTPEGDPIDQNQPLFSAALDFEANICYIGVLEVCSDAEYNPPTTTAEILDGRLAMLGSTGISSVIDQPHASSSFLVNPYTVYPGTPILSIDPYVDTWIEETVIEVPRSLSDSTIVSTTTKTVRKNVRDRKHVFSGYKYGGSSTKTVDTEVGTTVETYTEDSIISEEAIEYIRQREITVEGKDYPINLDNIKGYFDGKLVSLTPTGSTVSGTVAGSVKSNSSGYFTAKFTIPEGVKTGIREVKLSSDIEIVEVGGINWYTSASANYQAEGTKRTVQRTVTTVTTVLLSRVKTVTKTYYYDPVGQSFVFDRDTLLTSVDVYFEAKSTSIPISLEIRGVTNGMIDDTIYAHKTLSASDIHISADSSVATNFDLDEPVYCEANVLYAFVLTSVSDDYRVWVAEMGKDDILTGESILKNAYLYGTMYSSSNNAAWSIHQTIDMKFTLYTSTYTTSGIVNFKPITGLSAASIMITADDIVPDGTSIDWEYSTDGSNFFAIDTYNRVRLGFLATTVYLRATLTRDSEKTPMSPILALDTVSLITTKFSSTGDYIMKNITNLDDWDEAQVVVETYVPAGTSINFYSSVNDGSTWDLMTKDDSKSIARNFGWVEHTYVKTYATDHTSCRLRVQMSTNSGSESPAIRRYRGIITKDIVNG